MSECLTRGAQALRAWREQAGKTQEEVADLVDTDGQQISKYERGVWRPARKTAGKIEEVTGGAVPVSAWDEPADVSAESSPSPVGSP